jgi:tRNA G18 (ribose-2'-O)-methylase SpoU
VCSQESIAWPDWQTRPVREPVVITDPADSRVDAYRALRARESAEVMWAEGPTVVERLLATSLGVRSLLLTPAAHARLLDRCGALLAAKGADIWVAEQAVVNAIVDFDLHRGAIAVAERPTFGTLDTVISGARRLVVLEGVNDHENIGAIARTARALGADGMLLDPTCTDPFYRRSVRVSMGEVLHLPIARAPMDAIAAALDAAGVAVWALTPRADAADITSLAPPARLALLLGAEGPGLSAEALARHTPVRIPIRDEVDSLNVGHAVAAALAVVATSAL